MTKARSRPPATKSTLVLSSKIVDTPRASITLRDGSGVRDQDSPLLEYTHGGRWRPACFLNLLIQVVQHGSNQPRCALAQSPTRNRIFVATEIMGGRLSVAVGELKWCGERGWCAFGSHSSVRLVQLSADRVSPAAGFKTPRDTSQSNRRPRQPRSHRSGGGSALFPFC